MSTSFRIETFEKYLSTVRNHLPLRLASTSAARLRLISDNYPLKPSIARYDHLLTEVLPRARRT